MRRHFAAARGDPDGEAGTRDALIPGGHIVPVRAANGDAADEETLFKPLSPYAVAKLFAFATVVNFREAYGMYAVNGILYNHESSRRGTITCTIGQSPPHPT